MQKDNNLLDLEDYNTVEVEVEETQDAEKKNEDYPNLSIKLEQAQHSVDSSVNVKKRFEKVKDKYKEIVHAD